MPFPYSQRENCIEMGKKKFGFESVVLDNIKQFHRKR